MDLRTGTPFWAVQTGSLAVYPPLEADAEGDVLIVGAGICGALAAHRLTADNHRCIVIDRRDIGWGSTMASTALLQYEIDTPLRELADRTGLDDALTAYRLCGTAVEFYDSLTASLSDRCGFRRCRSLLLAKAESELDDLRHECELRRRAGLKAMPLDRRQLIDRYGIDRPAAILSDIAAVVEPYRLTHRLLAAARVRGARVYDRTSVTAMDPSPGGFTVTTDRGPSVRVRHIVVATGYEATQLLPKETAELRTTYAMATEPVEPARFPAWVQDHVLWETGDPYFYARPGPEGRILMGGLDERYNPQGVSEAALTDRALSLAETYAQLVPGVPVETAYRWSGAFARTEDGLGYFGRHPDRPGVDFLLGYGGNGMTFAAVFVSMLAAQYAGRTHEHAHIFRFNRAR